MRHEVVVPIPVQRIWEAVRDPDRLAECLPGLSTDERPSSPEVGGSRLVGRMRVRVAADMVTYRGVLRIQEDENLPLAFVAVLEGAEVGRGTPIRSELRLRLDDQGASTRLVFDTGHLDAQPPATPVTPAMSEPAQAAVLDVLERFAAALTGRLAPAGRRGHVGTMPVLPRGRAMPPLSRRQPGGPTGTSVTYARPDRLGRAAAGADVAPPRRGALAARPHHDVDADAPAGGHPDAETLADKRASDVVPCSVTRRTMLVRLAVPATLLLALAALVLRRLTGTGPEVAACVVPPV